MHVATLNKAPSKPLSRPAVEAYYEQPDLWKLARYHDDHDQRMRARAVSSLVDPLCASLLDVGCGNGFITRQLKARRVVGLDLSQAALAEFEGEYVCGSADNLPFDDASFDTVVCTELLEHLPQHSFERATREMVRVARRQIVIGVPFRENLFGGMTRCAECGRKYHISLHLRSFHNPKEILHWFDGFALEADLRVGTVSPRPGLILQARKVLVGPDVRSPFARCPDCGSARTVELTRKRVRRWLLDGLEWRLRTKTAPRWIIVSLRKK